MAPKGATVHRKRVFLVKTDPDATSVKETKPKRKKAGVTSSNSVTSNKGTPRKNARTREGAKKLPSSATRKRGSSVQDPNTSQSRGRGPVVTGRRGQKLSKNGDHGLKVSLNSQKKGSTRKVKNEEQPVPFAKTPLTKSKDARIRKGKNEVLSPPPGGSLKKTLLAKGRNSRLGAQKIAGSRSGTARNPRRVKSK